MPDIADKISGTLLALFEIGHHESECKEDPSRFIFTDAEQLASYIRAVIASEQG